MEASGTKSEVTVEPSRQEDSASTVGWPARRVAALALTFALVALGLYAWWADIRDVRMWWLLGVGSVLGLLYTVRGSSLPEFVHWFGGSGITADDDPRNLSPKLYLPILLVVLVAAVAAYYLYGPRR
jgi:hypothetical protein